ncbi:hypothetical protein Enr17x_04680 [Gimesia fumaroli]|uniref:Uncharacterized protein n=2 Tax=Gimesia fumaroli TaxID=2527976 RepID=A0A518I5S4_9PLAN|nr:hypothetical protein Enr17x_04680 [Gimesia fumaroli]
MTLEALISGLQNQHLRIPVDNYENVRRFTMTGQTESGRNRDNIPFERYVDIWWLALCIGIQEGRRTELKTDKWHQFVRAGEVLPSNPWRIFQLQLLAVGLTGGADILSKPGELIAMANEYAATGLPILLNEALGSQVPIWAMTDFVSNRLKDR